MLTRIFSTDLRKLTHRARALFLRKPPQSSWVDDTTPHWIISGLNDAPGTGGDRDVSSVFEDRRVN